MASYRLVLLTRRLSDLTVSGLPIGRSLELLAQQSEKATERELLQALSREIDNGRSFSEALTSQSGRFSPVYIGLVKAGETSGSLDSVLHELSQWLENEIDLRQRRPLARLMDPWQTLFGHPDRSIRVQARPRYRSGDFIEILAPAQPLKLMA
jgi:type II secretory pathway component PulF